MDKQDIPECIPEWLHEEYLKWQASPKRYETLYPVSTKTIKRYLQPKDSNEKDQKRPSK